MRYMEKENTSSGAKASAGIWEYDSRNGAIISSIAREYRRSGVKVFKANVNPLTGEVTKGDLLRIEDNGMTRTEYQLTFRQSLVALCEANEVDVPELVRNLDVTKTTAQHWFRDTMPTLYEVVKICRYFGVSIDAFLRRDPERCQEMAFQSSTIYDMLREADKATAHYNHLQKGTKAQFRHGRNCRIRHIWMACDEFGLSIDFLWKEASDGLAQEEKEGC